MSASHFRCEQERPEIVCRCSLRTRTGTGLLHQGRQEFGSPGGDAMPLLVCPGRNNGLRPLGRCCRAAQAGRPRNCALSRPGRARRSPSGGARCRDRDLRADMASGAPSGPGPRPRSGCLLPGLARRRGDPADDFAQCRGGGADRWSCALDRAAIDGTLARLADHAPDGGGNGRSQLAGPLCRSPTRFPVALSRPSSQPRGAERPDVIPCAPSHAHDGVSSGTVPVVALMPTRPMAPVLITIYVCIGTLQHANLRWTFGPACRVP